MRMSTEIWAKFESRGRPKDTRIIHGTVRVVMIEFAKWMTQTYMGSHINIKMARTEADLNVAVSGDAKDMMSELESILEEEGIEDQGELLDGQDQGPAPNLRIAGGKE